MRWRAADSAAALPGARPQSSLKNAFGYLLAGLAGLAHAASIALPGGPGPGNAPPQWGLQILALAALAWLLGRSSIAGRSRWAAFGLGWVFATAWLAGTFWWLFISLHTYGGLAAPLAVLAVGVLAGALALFYALICMLFSALANGKPAGDALLFAACWTLAELARGQFFTGFPWGAAGYAHVDGPLAGAAHVVGVYGVGAVAAFLAGCLASLWPVWRGPARRAWAYAGGGLALLAAVFLLPQMPSSQTQAAGELSVTLLQGNIPQDEKFQPGSGVPQALRWYREQLLASRSQLVAAPETAVPLLPAQMPDDYWPALTQHFAAPSRSQAALIGVPLGSFAQGYTNSAMGLAPSGEYVYHKHHLVPFGEFIPYGFRWFTELMNIPLGDFDRGGVGQPSLAFAGQRLAPNICYEDLFGEELGARFLDPSSAPTVFVNLSNIGWFGNSVAIDQHLHISRMRALEFQRPMIRATNTGATAIINHLGEVTHALAPHTRGVLEGVVQGRSGITPYAWWVSRYGLWPLWGLAIAIVAIAIAAKKLRARARFGP
ncbi:MAG: apolipoprotein N-acyltransferase [Burkholderiaceae bacterium]